VSRVSPVLSVVLPAYNEAHRLPPYLAAMRTYLDCRWPERYEVIVVDDGSQDGLPALLAHAAVDWPALRTLRHECNQGKGAAVRTGVLASQGRWVLFADADGATPIDQERRLCAAAQAGAEVIVGSRLADGEGLQRSRHWLRGISGRLFAAVARRLLHLSVRDTQCGFKMFRADAAQRLFAEVRETGFVFDLELLALAQCQGWKMVEVPVAWQEIPGGHFHLFRALPKILAGLWRVRQRVKRLARSQQHAAGQKWPG
jgi:dolichyl-phosphate beta-glucosyltransferase